MHPQISVFTRLTLAAHRCRECLVLRPTFLDALVQRLVRNARGIGELLKACVPLLPATGVNCDLNQGVCSFR